MGLTSTLSNIGSKIAGKFASAKAMIVIAGGNVEQIPVQFNPSDYRITNRSNFTEKERRQENEPTSVFKGKPFDTLNVKLYFDCDEPTSVSSMLTGAVSAIMGGEDKDITKTINKITSLTVIDGDKHKPPNAAFVWGTTQFVGFAESVVVSYTMFDKTGKPLRAVVDLTMRGTSGNASQKKSPLMSPDRTKARVMSEDNNIWNISKNEYGDVREWRRIADANGIMNPLDIPVGEMLRVPSIDE